MINIAELRIGNFMESVMPLRGSWAEKQRFDMEIYQVKSCTFEIPILDMFNPIPITVEWLKKLGFHEYKYSNGYHFSIYVDEFTIKYSHVDPHPNPGYYQGHDKFFIIGNGGEDDSGEMELDIKYTHQIQNLYFALTNTELKINAINS